MTDEELEKLAAEYSRKKCGHYSTCEHGAACKNCVMPDSFKDGFIEGAAAAEKLKAEIQRMRNCGNCGKWQKNDGVAWCTLPGNCRNLEKWEPVK